MKRIISVHVKPQATTDKVEERPDGSYHIETRAAAQDNRANQAIIRQLARHLGCTQSQLTIKSGHSGRKKLVIISG